MSSETTLHFFSGKMASGKSTLAIDLVKKHDAILLSEDAWLTQLYPEEIIDISGYLKYSTRLHGALAEHIQLLLQHKVSIVLDFPGNTVDQRSWFRSLYEQAEVSHNLHYIDVSDEICKRQLKERSKNKSEGSAFTSEAEFDAITQYFQAPTESEGFNIIRYEHRK